MPDQPYTDEDVSLVVRALFRAMYGEETTTPLADFPEHSPFLSQARAVLDALASACWVRRDRIDLGNPLGWTPEQIRQHEEWSAELDAAVDREEA